jgi:hypothetical protein
MSRHTQAALYERIVWRRGPCDSGLRGGYGGYGRCVQAASGACFERRIAASIGSLRRRQLSTRDGAWRVHARLQRVCAGSAHARIGLGGDEQRVELGERLLAGFEGGCRHRACLKNTLAVILDLVLYCPNYY